MTEIDRDTMREALKTVAAALKETGLPFALSGGYAAWAYGAPEPGHDVDFLVAPEDAERVFDELVERGLDAYQPPEDWLFKVNVEGVVVDVIHRATASATQDVLASSIPQPVLSIVMPVVTPTDLATEKLAVLDEHYCDLAAVIPVMRALRERVDWDVVRKKTAGHPFAEAVLFLLARLDIIGQP